MKIPKKINEAANAVAESLDAVVLVYSGSIDPEGYGGLIKTLESSKEQPPKPNVIMLLTTYGGDANQAYQIARLLQNIAEKFYLCVPAQCKSAGTLIALGANELFVTIVSELGPLDVQLSQRDEIDRRRSGMVVRTALDGLADETFKVFERVMLRITQRSRQAISFDVASRVAATVATGVMAPVYAQIDPESLGNDLRDLSVATAYGNRLVSYGGNATEETVRQLVEDYPAHRFIIDREEARDLFKTVNEPTEEINTLVTALGDIVYTEQSPHIILRLDGNFEEDEEDDHETDEDRYDDGDPPSMDQGRKTEGRSDHKRERKEKEPTSSHEGNSPGQKTDQNA